MAATEELIGEEILVRGLSFEAVLVPSLRRGLHCSAEDRSTADGGPRQKTQTETKASFIYCEIVAWLETLSNPQSPACRGH
jgi:hypothetical protein